jgi:DNA-binding XRE family transcriptional regulator
MISTVGSASLLPAFDTFSIYQGALTLSILKVSIRQLKAARTLIGWSQEELASAADVSLPTIKRLESVEGWLGGRQTTGQKICSALEKAGIEFIDENGGGPGVRLRKRQRLKKPKS